MPAAKKTPLAKKAAAATGTPAAKAPRTRAAVKPPAKARTAQSAAKATAKPAAKPTKATAKAAAQPKTAPAAAPKAKQKLMRDSFTMPQADFSLIAQLKSRALAFMRPAKKSELLRAGLHALVALDDARLRAALDALAPLKPGRPKKSA